MKRGEMFNVRQELVYTVQSRTFEHKNEIHILAWPRNCNNLNDPIALVGMLHS